MKKKNLQMNGGIIMLIITNIMIFTATQKSKISGQAFDILMILYGISYVVAIFYFSFKLIKKQ